MRLTYYMLQGTCKATNQTVWHPVAKLRQQGQKGTLYREQAATFDTAEDAKEFNQRYHNGEYTVIEVTRDRGY
jgi:hypothetical protein